MSFKMIMRNVVLAGAALVAFTGSVRAADVRSDKVRIPFPFEVQSKTLPAGDYRVERNFGSRIAFLRNEDTGEIVQVLVPAAIPYNEVTMVFEPNGVRYALKNIK